VRPLALALALLLLLPAARAQEDVRDPAKVSAMLDFDGCQVAPLGSQGLELLLQLSGLARRLADLEAEGLVLPLEYLDFNSKSALTIGDTLPLHPGEDRHGREDDQQNDGPRTAPRLFLKTVEAVVAGGVRVDHASGILLGGPESCQRFLPAVTLGAALRYNLRRKQR